MTEVRRSFALSTILAAFLAANSAIAQSERPQVTVDTGVLAGTLDEAGIRVFKGIPSRCASGR